MSLRTLFLASLAAAGALSAVTGCTTVLGEFDNEAGSASGSGGAATTTATVGSGGEGGGTPPPLVYECAPGSAKATVLDTLFQPKDGYVSELRIVEQGQPGKFRVLESVYDATPPLSRLVVRTPEQAGPPLVVSGLRTILDVARISASSIGVLAVASNLMTERLVLLEIPDASDKVEEHVLLAPENWAPNPNYLDFSGRLVAIDPRAPDWSIDVVVTFVDPAMARRARFGNFTRKGGKTVEFLDPKRPFFEKSLNVQSAFRSKASNRTFAYLSGKELTGTREFALDATVNGPVAPRVHGDANVFGVVDRGDSFNVLSLAVTPETYTFTILGGKLPNERLGKFVDNELLTFGKFNLTTTEFPVGDPAVGWYGDVYGFIGEMRLGDNPSGKLGYRLFDTSGTARGAGSFPVPPTDPPQNLPRDAMGNFAAALVGASVDDGVLDSPKEEFGVVWVERYQGVEGDFRNVVHGRLVCTGKPAP